MKSRQLLKHSIAIVTMLVSICCLSIVIITVIKLPEAQTNPIIRSRKVLLQDVKLGKFGEMMIDMLPQDLAFTVFVPSDEAFERDLHLRVNESLKFDKFNDTYAIVTRVLGFSAVPRPVPSVGLRCGELVSYESLSGFPLYIAKDVDGMIVVNRIRSEIVDVRRREIVVHVMDGVIMDAEFEQSVLSDEIEED